jgi:FlaA1/EpsC-like NDP-sugar epimerase
MSSTSLPGRTYSAKRVGRRLVAYLKNLVVIIFAAFFAFELRFDGAMPARYFHAMEVAMAIWAVTKMAAFILGAVNQEHWRHTSIYEAERIVFANAAGSILGGLAIYTLLGGSGGSRFGGTGIPRSVYVLDWILSCFFMLGTRLMARVIAAARKARQAEGKRTRTLIYGAGAAGLALLWELRQNQSLMIDVVGLIDDNPQTVGLTFDGKPVLGTGEELGAITRKHGVKRVLIAIPSATGPQMVRILKFAIDAGVDYKMVPSLGELIQGADLGKQIRDVAVEDLLGRKPVQLDQARLRERIYGKVVMVTGAGGSIGSEICRQIAQFRPLALVGLDSAETPLFQIERELEKSFPDLVFHAEIGSITRPDMLRRVMQHYQPSMLFHAAAYKHVSMMEKHVFAAVENNIFGTWQVALAAANNGVEDFVMISTDKAVRPTSMMGATKRVAELVIRALQMESGTKFVAVRFGNVLGSNGSVVPIFKEQIAAGGPVTVTHPEMRRYFMTIPEAAQLVLQAFSIGKGGEVFVLDMGESVKIVDLARDLILLSGLQPDRDIKIEFTGMRPGEKLFEELNLHDEHLVATSHAKIRSYASPYEVDVRQIKAYMQEFQQIVNTQDIARLVLLLKDLIPDYNPGSQLLKIALTAEPTHKPAPSKHQIPAGQAEGPVPVVKKLASATRMN